MNRLTGLDGIRAIACLMVVLHHAFQRLNANTAPGILVGIQHVFTTTAPVGVSVFFVLSGALLSQPYWRRYFNNQAMPELKEYVKRRAARIVPGFYLALVISMIIERILLPDVPDFTRRFIASLTFTSGFHYSTFFSTVLNGPLWSISFEVFSYVLLPFFMAGLFFFVHKRGIGTGISYWFVVLIIIMGINALVITYCQPDNINRGWQYGIVGGAKYWMPNYNPIGFFAHFLMGILASGLMLGIEENRQLKENMTRYYIFDAVSFMGLLLFVLLVITQTNTPDFGFSLQQQPYYWPWGAASIALTIAFVPSSKWVGAVLDNAFFKYTAKISFGVYIWHHLIMNLFTLESFRIDGCFEWSRLMLLAVAITYGIAALSWEYLESPILNAVHKDGKAEYSQTKVTS
ncbi:hypothetical protein P22_3857 [Propionispora sp. 2/2-37]|uniref:acyltransferase family protein n=1 Tax=Propionispora sp. 2/2-37 TaxID=1677858 RepID=UPI0006BB57FE|nr:acyltransferase [Propionispora sp. 2/2-37]CUH97722.1 hypothetical protein P22_3857 [Propionispora sp. 2/2-37]